MPLLEPETNESFNEFIERCIDDDDAKEEFPRPNQRLAVCITQWYDSNND